MFSSEKRKKQWFLKALSLSFLFVLLFSLSLFVLGCKKESIDTIAKKINNYTLNLSFDEKTNILSGQQTIDYINNTEIVLKQVCFHLYPNAFSQESKNSPVGILKKLDAYPNGTSYGKIDIKSLFVAGKTQEIKIGGDDNNILEVSLPLDLYPEDRIGIKIDYEVLLPNCLHRFGYGDNTYNFGNFYPIACVYEGGDFKKNIYSSNGDPFFSDMANYSVELTYNSDFILASSGEQKSTLDFESNKTTKIFAKAVRDFSFVLSKNYNVIKDKLGKTTVYYYYYDDEDFRQNLKVGKDALKTFNELFGQYPYSTLSIAKTNFIHGGMEYPNLVYISDSIERQSEYQNVIIHEIAHQWWYNLVGSNACDYAWLDEGLTEYSTLLFYKKNPSYKVNIQESLNSSLSSYLLFKEIYSSVYGSFDSSMSRNVCDFKSEMEYVYVTYVKGVLFFDNLCEVVGEKLFLRSLKLYFEQNKYKNATPEDLISAFEYVCKRNLEKFFDSWISGKVVLQNYK